MLLNASCIFFAAPGPQGLRGGRHGSPPIRDPLPRRPWRRRAGIWQVREGGGRQRRAGRGRGRTSAADPTSSYGSPGPDVGNAASVQSGENERCKSDIRRGRGRLDGRRRGPALAGGNATGSTGSSGWQLRAGSEPRRKQGALLSANPTFATVFQPRSGQTCRLQQFSAASFNKPAGCNSFRPQNEPKTAEIHGFAEIRTENVR